MDINLSKFREIVEDRGAWRAVVYGVEKSRTQLSDWTITMKPRENLSYKEMGNNGGQIRNVGVFLSLMPTSNP